jgi:hypothetical protein
VLASDPESWTPDGIAAKNHQMGIVLTSGAALGVAALTVGSAVIVGHDDSTAPAHEAHGQVSPAGELRAAEPDRVSRTRGEECDASATPRLLGRTTREGKLVNEDAAVQAARKMARPVQESLDTVSAVPDLRTYPAAASQLTFATADRWMPGSSEDSLVAPTRCVWMVTVDAPFQPRSTPENGTNTSYDSYTVLFDAASGEYLGVSAGSDTPNLITGKNVGADN